MFPFILLLVSWLAFRGIGLLGVAALASWSGAATYALALFFIFVAASHFASMKKDLVNMVPDWLPNPLAIVYVTGVLEVLGAVGLLLPMTRMAAGICLALLLIAMYPANLNASRKQIPLRGKPPTPFWLRLFMQIIYIGLCLWVAFA
ncbi:DoxX family protein [Ktedonospora formicarum]|uniref:DoxX family protein n=1 Tax=Ktedonospora formicarum TaxID=2778364 RepID=A0A8J3I6C9_9CHLR|nr:DoxX family protein [Ktedonospora formicarum]GHO48226.1 hypothetical protein KSX_63890 [Ktedonospora formicarum]